jgi:hypothetical protein
MREGKCGISGSVVSRFATYGLTVRAVRDWSIQRKFTSRFNRFLESFAIHYILEVIVPAPSLE